MSFRTVRKQPENGRWIVHLLNYDPRLSSVEEGELTLRPPSLANVRVFHPDDNSSVKHVRADGALRIRVRSFGVHEMIVVEWR